MNGCVIGNQERATLSPKMALTIESRETGGVRNSHGEMIR